MTLARRTIPFALGLAAGLLLIASPITAQDSTRVTPDSAAQDSAARRASLPRFVPIFEPEVPRGPLPRGSRHTFTRDSLVWTNAVTLAELLAAIPGAYVARAGWIGQSEYVVYGGRGARGLEVFWDGMPLVPVGGDSVYFDAARIYLTNLRRVDVEILPARLRVYLVSERHETLDDRSVVRVMSGDLGVAQYAGLFQKRWVNGLGLGLAANFAGSNGFSGANRSDNAFDVWARFEWLPTPRAGILYQIRRQNQDRDSITGSAGAPGRAGTRTDSQLKLFASTRPRGQGLGAELTFGTSGWGRDSIIGEQGIHRVMGTLRYASRIASLEVAGNLADRRTVRSGIVRAGISPIAGVILAGDAGTELYAGGRHGQHAHAVASLYRGPFSATGEIDFAKLVQAPAIRADTAQRTIDRLVRVGLDTRRLSGHVGLAERDAYAPLGFPDLPVISLLAPSPRSTFFIADFTLRPLRPLTLDGWYANPVRGQQDFQPPTHGRVQLTFRSKFWRTFRSGAFDLKLQLAMESWSEGTAGLTSAAVPISLNGITFYEAFVSFQIVGFTAFWNLHNAYNAREQYVPGMPYPRNAQTFGVRWEFFN